MHIIQFQVTVHLPEVIDSIDQLETHINSAGQKVKQRLFERTFAQIASRAKATDENPMGCPNCGKRTVSIGNRRRKLKTAFGEVKVQLPRRKCCACTTSFGPVESSMLEFGCLKNSNTTQRLRQLAILLGSSWPYRQAAKVLEDLTGVKISGKQIQRLCQSEAEQLAERRAQANEESQFEALAETMEVLVDLIKVEPKAGKKTDANDSKETPNRVYTAIDGTFVNAQEASKYFEAKAAILFTDDRTRISERRNQLTHKQYVASCQSVKEFGESLLTSVTDFPVTEQTEHIILGDGAKWINRLAATQYPKAKFILDWWHLKKRVWETVNWLQKNGISEEKAVRWGREVVSRLWRGETASALATFESLSKEVSIPDSTDSSAADHDPRHFKALSHYITANQGSIINYHSFKQSGYCISSVFVEKTMDLLICRRMKLRGQNFRQDGADNILAFRQLVFNDQWDTYWHPQTAA
jgi:hypothetical protein